MLSFEFVFFKCVMSMVLFVCFYAGRQANCWQNAGRQDTRDTKRNLSQKINLKRLEIDFCQFL